MKKYFARHPAVSQVLFFVMVIVCFTGWISPPVALLSGFLFSELIGHPFLELSSKATTQLLRTCVVCLGFGIHLDTAITAGREGFSFTVATIAITMVLGFLAGRLLKINRATTHLVSSGTAICGGSAIAAVAPVIGASDRDISVSLGIVFMLNAVALFLFPLAGHLMNMSQYQFGLWCAIAIHDTSSVVGAASAFGDEALQVATIVKLARALWIIPLAVATAIVFRSKGTKVKWPWFIIWFLLAIVVNSYVPQLSGITPHIVSAARKGLVLTLFLIGAGLSLKQIREVGWKPLLLGIILWFVISLVSLAVIRNVF
ncbi:MAG TPA: putative sulfate exporter family transporter [Chitinophagaceae bacterium]